MGVGYQGLQFTLLAKRRKVDFTRTITFGNQNHYLEPNMLKSMFDRFGFALDDDEIKNILKDAYSTALFRKLGAVKVDSIDASDYEGANIIHDLNRPIHKALVQQYTCVIDFGVLEHVFNFPVAIKNATDLLKVDGNFISVTTANNFLGHGFYQFSPELFFNYLARNGFANIEVYLIPYRVFPYFFRVTEPTKVQNRVELVNNEPMLMGIIARKLQHLRETVVPIQSDYYNVFWQGHDVSRESKLPLHDLQLAEKMQDLKNRISSLIAWIETVSPLFLEGFENSLHYQLIDPAKD